MSEQSDIDVDELNDSLNSAISYKREKKRHEKKGENTEPFVYPLEFSDSEVGNSSDDEPLSVIDEVEEIEEIEEDSRKIASTESAQERSRSSHSTSDSFKSDDDVMDLLGEEPGDSMKGNAVTTANIRKISQENEADDAALEQTDEGNQASLQKYLVSTAERTESGKGEDGNRTYSTGPVETGEGAGHNRTYSAEPAETGEGGYYNQTYSDIEADQPNETSTPRMSRTHPEQHHETVEQETTLRDENYESDTEGNRTYTVSEREEYPEEEKEEEMVRIFIALYDYDPTEMSPNPGAEEDELAFNEGDLIKVRLLVLYHLTKGVRKTSLLLTRKPIVINRSMVIKMKMDFTGASWTA